MSMAGGHLHTASSGSTSERGHSLTPWLTRPISGMNNQTGISTHFLSSSFRHIHQKFHL